ncbi:MAG TPA: hypothetical protein VMW10_06505 [Alphaproteobacteria bacterium]|nr:hypothetical protein [Alphaproteobacteria bacterium]
MVYAHVIGRDYEYRVRNWFIKKGWKSERNPLSGASDQIEQELGKHDVRSWKEDLRIFLQLECKKTSKADDKLVIQKEWLDKIDFTNDEFLVFSYQRCKQHFAFMPKEEAEKVIGPLNLNKSTPHEAKGGAGFSFKREWVENIDGIFVCEFLDRTWYIFDLEIYVDAREQFKIPTKPTSFSEKVKTITDIEGLKKLREEEESEWGTKEYRIYYSKLERLESGDVTYNPEFIKEGQWWMPEKDRFDWDENTIKSISEKVNDWVDKNLEESEEGEMVWAFGAEIDSLEKDIEKILGLDKKKER